MKKIFFYLLLLCPLAYAETTPEKTPATTPEPCYKVGMVLAPLTECANKGDAIAQNNLGLMYLQGQGVAKDDKTAFEWLSKAAKQNQSDAQNALGVIYEKGYGVPVDTTKAFEWYSKAAEQGDSTAQFKLGLMYHMGCGVPQDHVLRYMWFNLAVAHGNADAIKFKAITLKAMTPDQIDKAQKKSMEWLAKHS